MQPEFSDEENFALEQLITALEANESELFQLDLAKEDDSLQSYSQFFEVLALMGLADTPLRKPRLSLKSRIFAVIDKQPSVVFTDKEGRILGINDAFTAMCGYQLSELLGQKPGSLLQGELTNKETADYMSACVRQAMPCQAEILNYHRNGSPYWVSISIQPLRSTTGDLVGFTAVENKIRDRPIPQAA